MLFGCGVGLDHENAVKGRYAGYVAEEFTFPDGVFLDDFDPIFGILLGTATGAAGEEGKTAMAIRVKKKGRILKL